MPKKGDGLGNLGRLPTEVRLLVLEDLLRGAILHAKPTVMADGNTTDRHPPLHIFTNIEHDTILHVSDQLHCEAMDALAMSIHLVVPGCIHGRVKLQDPLRNLPNPFLASLKTMQVSMQHYKFVDRDRLRSLTKLHLLQVIDGTGELPTFAKTMKNAKSRTITRRCDGRCPRLASTGQGHQSLRESTVCSCVHDNPCGKPSSC
jgi:hypothetical protein